MIGLDTNVLVRYITQDDAAQAPKANRLIRNFEDGDPAFVSTATDQKQEKKKESKNDNKAEDIALAVERLLTSNAFVLENEREVFSAKSALRQGADFADALIAATGLRVGCLHTLTFDRKASRLPGFALLA